MLQAPYINGPILLLVANLPNGSFVRSDVPKLHTVADGRTQMLARLVRDGLVRTAGEAVYEVANKTLPTLAVEAATQLDAHLSLLHPYRKKTQPYAAFCDAFRSRTALPLLASLPQDAVDPRLADVAGVADKQLRRACDPLIRNHLIERHGYGKVTFADVPPAILDLTKAYSDFLAAQVLPTDGVCIHNRGLEIAYLSASAPPQAQLQLASALAGQPVCFDGPRALDVLDSLVFGVLASMAGKPAWQGADIALEALSTHLDGRSLANVKVKQRLQFYGLGGLYDALLTAVMKPRGPITALRPLSDSPTSAWPP